MSFLNESIEDGVKVRTSARDDGTGNPVTDISVGESKIIAPVDIQARYSETIQTHTSAMVAPSNGVNSQFFSCDGYNELALSYINDASANSSMILSWSHDGANVHGEETVFTSSTSPRRAISVPVKAKFFRLYLINADTVVHTMSAWAYLKA